MKLLDESKKQKALQMAKSLADTFHPTKAKEFIQKHQNAQWYKDALLLYEMITDKEYTISKELYLAIAGALAYAVMPMDVIPDFILGLGFLDDAFVISFVIKKFADEIAKYKASKEELKNVKKT